MTAWAAGARSPTGAARIHRWRPARQEALSTCGLAAEVLTEARTRREGEALDEARKRKSEALEGIQAAKA